MKSSLSRVLLFSIIAVLISCSETIEEKRINIGFSQGLGGHPWREAMNHSMEVQASLYSNIDLNIQKAEGVVQKQVEDIRSMIDNKVDVIIISPIEPDTLVPIIEEAYSKGIPVVLLDRKINSDKYTTYIGADNLEVGREAGNYILSISQKKPVNVIEIKGDDSSSPTRERSKGFHEVVDNEANINLIKSFRGLPPNDFMETINAVGDNNIDFVFSFNDELAAQAWEIARKSGVENDIKFIGVDGLNFDKGGIQMVLDGKFSATILYPTGGAEAIEAAAKISNGETVSKRQVLTTTIIDRFNADIMRNQFNIIDEQQTTI